MRRWPIAALVLLLGRGRRRPPARRRRPPERILPRHRAPARAELGVLALLAAATVAALAFVVLYAVEPDTQLLGLALGLALACLAAAAGLASARLVAQEEASEPRPPTPKPHAEADVARLVHEAGTGITRRRLLVVAAGGAGAALGAALVVPAASLGPALGERLVSSPWRPGRLLVDERGLPLRPDAVSEGAFLTAFAEGADRHDLGSAVVVVRLDPDELELPSDWGDWAVDGILAFSKICTHAGCAVSIYRHPTYEPTSARPALVCPCHYSGFDPRRGGAVLFGPAARALPQLPLAVDDEGRLQAAGDFSDFVGPSYSGLDA
jgi:ubiquinol-cytochrome c reductase iron-sulfur subunit